MNRNRLVLLIWLSLIAVVISYRSWVLPSDPKSIVDMWLLLLVTGFYVFVVGFILWHGRAGSKPQIAKAVAPICLFSLAFIVSLYAGAPVFKTHAAAAELTKQKQSAVSIAIQLGKQVQAGNLSDEQARRELDKISADVETVPVAAQAYNLATTTDMTDTELEQEVAPTIPVRLNQWTCSQVGCSFADAEYIWTVTYRQRAISAVFVLASLGFVILSVAALAIDSKSKNSRM